MFCLDADISGFIQSSHGTAASFTKPEAAVRPSALCTSPVLLQCKFPLSAASLLSCIPSSP
jgi:hypothetical protein